MVDVLIRGIEMPCNAEGCEVIIRIQPNGEVLDAHKIHIGATAIPLPDEYGRLGDLDALENELAFDYAYAAAKVCHDALTIIPAKAGNVITTREELFAAVRRIIKNCKEQIIHDCDECALYDYCFDGMPFFGRAPCNWPDPEEAGGNADGN